CYCGRKSGYAWTRILKYCGFHPAFGNGGHLVLSSTGWTRLIGEGQNFETSQGSVRVLTPQVSRRLDTSVASPGNIGTACMWWDRG
ncbi:MAG: hypothetical protein M1294_15875, partial [Firmicutes bacterium]|nr:hypothetical protein [Bacillota bacterium]